MTPFGSSPEIISLIHLVAHAVVSDFIAASSGREQYPLRMVPAIVCLLGGFSVGVLRAIMSTIRWVRYSKVREWAALDNYAAAWENIRGTWGQR